MAEERRVPRHSVECPATFVVEDVDGAGVVFNLSEQGCAIASAVSVPDEGYASVSITLPGQADPALVELARVRWATRQEFGLEFRIVSRAARRRLQRFLSLDQAA